MLLHSNIIIYAGQTPTGALRSVLQAPAVSASSVSRVEVLGFHRLTAAYAATYQLIFQRLRLYPVVDEVIDRAIALRQQKKMSLGDASPPRH